MTPLYRVDGDWPKYGIDACMRNAFLVYCRDHDSKPSTVYCSNNIGQLYQLSLVGFATKHNLKIVFVPRRDFEKPYFYFGQDGESIGAN